MRLVGIKTKDEANEFLKRYLPVGEVEDPEEPGRPLRDGPSTLPE
jgi:hypothetical protein